MMNLSAETVQQTLDSQKENTMKAIVGDTYGSPDVLELRDIDRPEISQRIALVLTLFGEPSAISFQPRDFG